MTWQTWYDGLGPYDDAEKEVDGEEEYQDED